METTAVRFAASLHEIALWMWITSFQDQKAGPRPSKTCKCFAASAIAQKAIEMTRISVLGRQRSPKLNMARVFFANERL